MPDSVGRLLVDALSRYRRSDPDNIYDEVLRDVADRGALAASLGKADIGSLVMWKRITAQTRWASALGKTPDETVRASTALAWSHANDTSLPIPEAGQRARDALRGISGLGGSGALASAVLLACAPSRMAVWDRRVGTSLEWLGLASLPLTRYYGAYLERLLSLGSLMDEQDQGDLLITPRDVDLALYQLAEAPDLRTRAVALRR